MSATKENVKDMEKPALKEKELTFNKRKGKFSDGEILSIYLNPNHAPNELCETYSQVLISQDTTHILVPIGRYQFFERKITIEGPVTVGKFKGAVEAYYKEDLTEKDMKDLAPFEKEDTFEYIKDARLEIAAGKKVPRYEIMGDCIFFEGLCPSKNEPNTYSMMLGS